MKIAKTTYALVALASAASTFAHDSALPHAHPHSSSHVTSWAILLATIGGLALFGTIVYGLRKLSVSNNKDA